MTFTAPLLILAPHHSQELRARLAPRFGERTKAVTLGPEFGLPLGRYYVHPDGSLTRPSDELKARNQRLGASLRAIAEALQPVWVSIQDASTQDQSDFTKGA